MGLHDCQEINKEDLAKLLQENGWYISGIGVTHGGAEEGIPITSCEMKSRMVLIRFPDPESQRVTKHMRTVIIEENQACFLTHPWQVLVSEPDMPFARPIVRKDDQESDTSAEKAPPGMGINMSYIYFSLYRKEDVEQYERAERERETRETAERGKRLESKINDLYKGKVVKQIEYYSGFSINILFEDAAPIVIEHNYEDGECYFMLNHVNLDFNEFDEDADSIRPEDWAEEGIDENE